MKKSTEFGEDNNHEISRIIVGSTIVRGVFQSIESLSHIGKAGQIMSINIEYLRDNKS